MKIKILRIGIHKERKIYDGVIMSKTNPICSSVTLLQGKKNILVDTGSKGFGRKIIKELEKKGLKRKDIDFIINSHEHQDHCYNNYLFKNAKIIMDGSVWEEKKVTKYCDPEKINIPGIKIVNTPGHTPEHIGVLVEINEKKYFIAGDSVNEDYIIKGRLQEYKNKKQIIESALKVFMLADIIIPGHGKIIKKNRINKLKKIIENELKD